MKEKIKPITKSLLEISAVNIKNFKINFDSIYLFFTISQINKCLRRLKNFDEDINEYIESTKDFIDEIKISELSSKEKVLYINGLLYIFKYFNIHKKKGKIDSSTLDVNIVTDYYKLAEKISLRDVQLLKFNLPMYIKTVRDIMNESKNKKIK